MQVGGPGGGGGRRHGGELHAQSSPHVREENQHPGQRGDGQAVHRDRGLHEEDVAGSICEWRRDEGREKGG